MTPERFTDWLQGFVEIANTDTISEKQWQIIKDHLKLVFDKKTPDRSTYVSPTITKLSDIDWSKVGNPVLTC